MNFETKIDIKPKTREEIIALLNQQLADTFDLYSQTKQAHWNVKGMQFHQLHELFDTLAGELLDYSDLLAERATALGGADRGKVRMSSEASRLMEAPLAFGDSKSCVEVISDRFANLAKSTRQAIDAASDREDQGTADLFTESSRGLDKSLWFLEAHLQG